MAFRSILFDGEGPVPGTAASPGADAFADLHLDQIVAAVTAGREPYELAAFFREPLPDLAAITYRHEVFRDLRRAALLGAIRAFAEGMEATRQHLVHAGRSHDRYEAARWFLEAADAYGTAVRGLAADPALATAPSRGFRGLHAYLAAYVGSLAFTELTADTDRVRSGLQAVTYRLHIAGSRVRVSHGRGEPDYSADVLGTFEKFKQAEGKARRFRFRAGADLNHVEAAILDRVALLFPDVFRELDAFRACHGDYLDETVARFDREVQFYVAYLEHIERFKPLGLSFCEPEVTDQSKAIRGEAVFDLALAGTVLEEHGRVVVNDFDLRGPERILVVSGPNQGGKTTFARTIGQLHHLARIGCPVPGTAARLFLVDRIFTHFEREEDLANLSGKLEDELRRFHGILAAATPASLLVMNESFGSTTLADALFLNKAMLRAIIDLDLLCVTVTFLDELASLGPSTVSMVASIDPRDPTVRTFRLERRPADGLAYAAAIAEKYHLTAGDIRTRVAR